MKYKHELACNAAANLLTIKLGFVNERRRLLPNPTEFIYQLGWSPEFLTEFECEDFVFSLDQFVYYSKTLSDLVD